MSQDRITPRKGALGKGISSLLGEFNLDDDVEIVNEPVRKKLRDVESEVLRLKIEDIAPNKDQPRKKFDEVKLRELSASIAQDGVLQPILVCWNEEQKKYVIIAGERRWRASKLAGLEIIPAIVKVYSEAERLRLALIENIQRADLNVIEEARAYHALIRDHGLTQDMCAKRVGKDRSTITNLLRLLRLPPVVQQFVVEGKISMGHARALLSLQDNQQIIDLAKRVIEEDLSVRKVEQACRGEGEEKKPAAQKTKAKAVDPNLDYVAETLRAKLQTKVKISGNSKTGKIEIHYFNADELDRIVSKLKSM